MYRAQVAAELSPGTEGELVHYIRKDQLQQRAFAYAQPKSSRKRAALHYKCLATTAGRSELEIYPATGRYHQIRVQLAAEGWPIIGDTRYGAAVALPGNRIMLHADRLEFLDPQTNEGRVVVAPAPPDEAWLTGAQ
jgi:23S rRNA pseudouridine1911/1915/1917 synthase